MAKIRTTEPIACYASDPYKKDYVQIEMVEVPNSRTATGITFNITDYSIVLNQMTIPGSDEPTTVWMLSNTLRKKQFTVSKELYTQLYSSAEQLLPEGIDAFDKEKKIEEIAFEIYFKNDFLKDETGVTTEFVLYKTLPSIWEIV